MAGTMRLDKYLADMGKGTRSQVREAVRKGRVQINGETVKKPEQKVRLPEDRVVFDGHPVEYVSMEYYMLNKPAGTVSATEDGRYPTVVSLIGERVRKDLFRWDGWIWTRRDFFLSPMTELWLTGFWLPENMWIKPILPDAAGWFRRERRQSLKKGSSFLTVFPVCLQS